MAKRWAEADLRFLRDNAATMDTQALAERLGARVDEVEKKVDQLGLTAPDAGSALKQHSSFREMFRHSEAARREYEKGAAALQKKKYDEAEKHFRALTEQYGDEKELADRARLYLSVCEKHKAASARAVPESQDPYYLGLFEKNRGNWGAAIEELKKASRRPDGRVAFLLACCYAQTGEPEKALEALERAIAIDELNRQFARRDPDLEPVRQRPEFQNLTAATA